MVQTLDHWNGWYTIVEEDPLSPLNTQLIWCMCAHPVCAHNQMMSCHSLSFPPFSDMLCLPLRMISFWHLVALLRRFLMQ